MHHTNLLPPHLLNLQVEIECMDEVDGVILRILGNLVSHPDLPGFTKSPTLEQLQAFTAALRSKMGPFLSSLVASSSSIAEQVRHLLRPEQMSIRSALKGLASSGESKAKSYKTLMVTDAQREKQMKRFGAEGAEPVPSLAVQRARR